MKSIERPHITLFRYEARGPFCILERGALQLTHYTILWRILFQLRALQKYAMTLSFTLLVKDKPYKLCWWSCLKFPRPKYNTWVSFSYVITNKEYPTPFLEIEFKQPSPPKKLSGNFLFPILELLLKTSKEFFSYKSSETLKKYTYLKNIFLDLISVSHIEDVFCQNSNIFES